MPTPRTNTNSNTNKVWTKEEIKDLLLRSDKAVAHAVKRIYELQTPEEQSAQYTLLNNNLGFNKIDSSILTSIAEFYIAKNYLTDKQIELTRKKIIKYVKQLTAIANGELLAI